MATSIGPVKGVSTCIDEIKTGENESIQENKKTCFQTGSLQLDENNEATVKGHT